MSLTTSPFAGTILAYADYQHGIESGCTGIRVIDLATRRTVLELPEVGCTVDGGFVKTGGVTSLVVNEHGSVAWIVSRGRYEAESFELHTATGSGLTALLDEGSRIAPGWLHLSSGGEITWLDAGRALYAALAY
jgi:hypothetical protein